MFSILDVEKFVKTIVNNDLESEDENINKDNKLLMSNNIHIIKDNREEDKSLSSENDENNKFNHFDEDVSISEELNDMKDFDDGCQNIDNLEKFIHQFDDLKVTVNREKNSEIDDIIDDTLSL